MTIAQELLKNKNIKSYVGEPAPKSRAADKETATARGEPWIKVTDTKVNPDNVRNGFFELDWNEPFIEVLLDHGYIGESQEEIVEKWFNDVITEMVREEGIEVDTPSGNVVNFLKQEAE